MAIMLGIDLGTSGVKVIAVGEKGEILASSSENYQLIQPRDGWSEQDPQDWWNGTVTAVRKIATAPEVKSEEITALSISGQMHGSVFLDKQNKIIRNPLLWNDTRTHEQCRYITETVGEEKLLELVGNPALEGFTAPKLLWLRDHEPEHYNRLKTLLLPKDYILYRLTGRLCSEYSDAAGSLLLNVREHRWSEELCRILDIDTAILPELLESTDVAGMLTNEAADAMGLSGRVKVVAGGADNACSAVGNGIVREGIILASIGSSGVVLAHTDSMHHDPGGRIHSFNHARPQSWYLMGVMLSAGLSMSWMKNQLFRTDYDTINSGATTVPPGSYGLVFLPYLFGERTPHRNPMARGVFFGISGIHEQKHFMRAVFEGVTFGLKDSLELIKGLGVLPSEIRITGGGARSKLWRHILADVFESDVVTMKADEGPAFGAALLAGVGAGVFSSVEEAVDHTVKTAESTHPDADNSAQYREFYPVFKKLYAQLKPVYSELFDLRNK